VVISHLFWKNVADLHVASAKRFEQYGILERGRGMLSLSEDGKRK